MSIEKPTLKDQINDLQTKADKLHTESRIEQNIVKKKELMSRRAKIVQQLNDLKLKRTEQKENQAIKDLDELFRQHERYLAIEVNGVRITLNENLEIPITCRPCGHEHLLHVKELLRHQRNVKLESVLLSKWQGILTTNVNLQARFNCQRCRTEIEKRFKKTRHRREGETVGTVLVTLRKL